MATGDNPADEGSRHTARGADCGDEPVVQVALATAAQRNVDACEVVQKRRSDADLVASALLAVVPDRLAGGGIAQLA